MNQSCWLVTDVMPRFGSLDEDITVDVVIVGAGITGVTAAYLLKRSGLSVALVERDRCGMGDTSRTTAHLTCLPDLLPTQMLNRLGHGEAHVAWTAGQEAIFQIQQIVETLQIDCGFHRVPGYLMGSISEGAHDQTRLIQREIDAVHDMGFAADKVESVPIFGLPGMRLSQQALFHPLRYLGAMLSTIDGAGSYVFEDTEVKSISDNGSPKVCTEHCSIDCHYVVIATHVPIVGKNSMARAMLLQSKLSPCSSYAIGAKLPPRSLPQALFWDTSHPYYYCRIHAEPTHDYVIFGGKDHKTGQIAHTQLCYDALEAMLLKHFPDAKVHRKWSGQVIETCDGLPLIGNLSERQMIATGFAGNGVTFGTISAMMACDLAQGRRNSWTAMFDPHRRSILTGTWDYVKQNMDYPYYMARDWLKPPEGRSLDVLQPGEARVIKMDGKRVAAYRDENGELSAVSAVCTHMGCVVHWNEAEKTWDCPCHGSRFRPTGEVLAGPAETPLQAVAHEAIHVPAGCEQAKNGG